MLHGMLTLPISWLQEKSQLTGRHKTKNISLRRFIPIIGRSLCEDSFLCEDSNIVLIRILEGVCPKKSSKEFSVTAMRVPVEVTSPPRRLL